MSNDVFKDLGFSKEESEDLSLRTMLIDGILRTVEKHGYTSKELQIILQQPQPEVSYLLNGKVSRFSSDKLLRFLNRLNAKVEVNVKMPRKKIAV